ncbi:helix-hairpin-helix domain-containing protein [Veillonella ratti]|uniref:helix-hairpin-helix domain-containing protein n=1 Tax=Veillonella ratti TaxID=103892 RepID=UPI000F8E07E7|nr:helix-hairpin-helix domain-containing protein [Veillonella ratti]
MEQLQKHKKVWLLLAISIFLYLVVLRPIISDSSEQMNTSDAVAASTAANRRANDGEADSSLINSSKGSDHSISTSKDNRNSDFNNNSGGDNQFVYVTGAVETPGLYKVREGETVGDAIQGAGGLLPYASVDTLNLAEAATSGSHIHVTFNFMGNPEELLRRQKININTATEQELTKLSGVGPGTAKKIIAYREQSGPFKAIEDLKKVKGIGDATFKKLAPHITI